MELKADHLQKTYASTIVLEDISFSLAKGQKVGLVGNNGSGKSTLLKILAGLIEPDRGSVIRRAGAIVSYLPQDTSLVTEESIRDYVRRVTGIADLEREMESSPPAFEEYERRNGYAFDHRLDATLAGLGLRQIKADRPINQLSSGQRSKVFMAGVLLRDPDVMLLDEPTNNLDLPALYWLEDFLSRSEQACIVVSHDRLFLDRLVRKIFEINWNDRKLRITSGKYSDYLARLEQEQARHWAEYDAQQEEIKRLTDSARAKKAEATQGSQYRGTDNDKFHRGFKRDRAGRSGRVAKAIERRLEHMEKVEKPIERDAFRISIDPVVPDGSRTVSLDRVEAGYEANGFRVGPITLSVPYGHRLVIIGLNGSGKTTLMKTISGDLPPLAGEVHIGTGLVIGNLMQEHDSLPRDESVKAFLVRRTGLSVQDAYALIARHGFKADEIDKQVSTFSPGGRARLLLALFSAQAVNVLLLDEPTNHLDLEAMSALEEAVKHFSGTIVLVSHDRYFLQKVDITDTYLLVEGQLIRQSSFAAYAAKAEQEAKRYITML